LTASSLARRRKWCRRKSTVGIAPGAHRVGRLHESGMPHATPSHARASRRPMTGSVVAGPWQPGPDRGGGLADSLLFTTKPAIDSAADGSRRAASPGSRSRHAPCRFPAVCRKSPRTAAQDGQASK